MENYPSFSHTHKKKIKTNHKTQSTSFSHHSWSMSTLLSQEIQGQAILNAWLYNLLQGVIYTHKFIVFLLRSGELLNYKTP